MNAKPIIAVMLAIAALSGASHAHEDGVKGAAKHGGQYLMDEMHHGVEMVADADRITFYMTEHLEPADMTGGSFKAIVQTGEGTKIVPLAIDADKLSAALDAALPKGAKVALSGKDGHGHTIQARFVKD